MINAKGKEVRLEGSIHEVLRDLMDIAEAIEQALTSREFEDAGTLVLETVAFALCSEEERKEILEERREICTE